MLNGGGILWYAEGGKFKGFLAKNHFKGGYVLVAQLRRLANTPERGYKKSQKVTALNLRTCAHRIAAR